MKLINRTLKSSNKIHSSSGPKKTGQLASGFSKKNNINPIKFTFNQYNNVRLFSSKGSFLKNKPNQFTKKTELNKNHFKKFSTAQPKAAEKIETPKSSPTLASFFRDQFTQYEHKDLFITKEVNYMAKVWRWTWKESQEYSRSFAEGLLQASQFPGQRFGSMLPNYAENFVAQIGCAQIGVPYVGIDPQTTPENLVPHLDLGLRGLITCPMVPSQKHEELARILPELEEVDDHELFTSNRFPDLRLVVHTNFNRQRGMVAYTDLQSTDVMPQVSLFNKVPAFKPSYIAQIQPIVDAETNSVSAEVYTHENVLKTATEVSKMLGLSLTDRVCTTLPWNTFYGSTLSIWTPISSGSVIVSPSASFDPAEALRVLAEDHCTHFFATAQQASEIFSHQNLERTNLSELKGITIVQTGDQFITPSNIPQRINVTQFAPREGLFFKNGKASPLPGIQTRVSPAGVFESKGYHLPPAVIQKGSKDITANNEWVPSLNKNLKL